MFTRKLLPWRLALVVATLAIFAPGFTTRSLAQQSSYLITAPDSSLSLYDLTTNTLIRKINQGTADSSVRSERMRAWPSLPAQATSR
jgi:hypothetical protein